MTMPKIIKYAPMMLALISQITQADESQCYGTTANGHLENGVQLPAEGKNYVAYSDIGRMLGRTYVHSVVRAIVLDAYAMLEKEQPAKVYKYAETGFKEGGEFKPHKSHRNGLSIDFMTPVVNQAGISEVLPTHPLNKFGYSIEFDGAGNFDGYRIDYDAMAAHLVALHKAAKAKGYNIWRVIFDPKLQPGLYNTRYAGYIRDNITLSQKPSWVRHDEHYHVDFEIPCKK